MCQEPCKKLYISFLYSFRILKHNRPNFFCSFWLLELRYLMKFCSEGSSIRKDVNRPILSLLNLGHFIRQWNSFSTSFWQMLHFRSSNSNLFAPHLPLSTKKTCELKRTFVIATLKALLFKHRYASKQNLFFKLLNSLLFDVIATWAPHYCKYMSTALCLKIDKNCSSL